MRCLTVKQPFASLLCWNIKDVENRSQKTNIRGKVLIHAGAQWHEYAKGEQDNQFGLTDAQWLDLLPYQRSHFRHYKNYPLPFSAIIGEVEIVDCVQNHPSVWAIDGYRHWVVKNAITYPEPILNVKGALSFWNPKGALVDRILEQRFLAIAKENYI